MATSPSYAGTTATAIAQISAANTNRDGTGTIVDVGTAAPSAGRRYDKITIAATGTTTAGVVRLFFYNGSAYRLWKEILVQAVTPSTSVAVWNYTLYETFVLPSGYKLAASTNNAETFNVSVDIAGDLT